METISAVVVEVEEKYFIKIGNNKTVEIPISEDDPNAVKKAFNKIILRLKKGKFQITLTEESEDLFYQVAKEYIKQLNKEILEVHGEMEQFDLIDS